MRSSRHSELQTTLLDFKEDCLARISQSYGSLKQDLLEAQQTITLQVEARFSTVESMLNGPYNKVLEWEWVPEASPCRAISQALLQRRIRLKELPEFEISAKDYFTKFARNNEEIVKELTTIGFYLPPNSKLFEHFIADVIEGKKLIIALSDLRRAKIPDDQVDLAFPKAQRMTTTDADLQKFLPHDHPDSLADKTYFLDIVNSLRGLHYKVILPLTDKEQAIAGNIRQTASMACEEIGKAADVAEGVGRLRTLLEAVRSPQEDVSGYLEAFGEWSQKLERLEQGEELMDLGESEW